MLAALLADLSKPDDFLTGVSEYSRWKPGIFTGV